MSCTTFQNQYPRVNENPFTAKTIDFQINEHNYDNFQCAYNDISQTD